MEICKWSNLAHVVSHTRKRGHQRTFPPVYANTIPSHRLLAVINDVLDFAKLTSGNVDVNIQQTNIRDILQTVVTSIHFGRKGKDVRIRSMCDPEVPEFLDTDSRLLQQVFYNLLSNAQKFSHEGSFIDLKAFVSPEQLSKQDGRSTLADGAIRFTVKDYGKGIKASDLETIFAPFVSLDQQVNQEGTGLGLSITQKNVECLGKSSV